MENSVEQDDNNPEDFLQWYVDMIENYPNTFVHYLSEDALLQWFGRSVRGPDRILYFIKTNMQGTKHIIGIQNTAGTSGNTSVANNISLPIESESSPSKSCASDNQTQLDLTPESNMSTVHLDLIEKDEFACGDGPNIDKLSLNNTENCCKTRNNPANFFESTGVIEFCRSCYKRGVADSKWERPCTLKVGYVGGLANPIDFNIQLIIYADNIPCKRNLLPEFDQCLSDD